MCMLIHTYMHEFLHFFKSLMRHTQVCTNTSQCQSGYLINSVEGAPRTSHIQQVDHHTHTHTTPTASLKIESGW